MSARVLIVGAGIAGLACAHALRAGGLSPIVLEKSRGLGGRLATRRTRDGLDFDHGAPCVVAANRAFGAFLDEAEARGDARPWRDETVGAPGMSALPRLLAEGVETRFETRVVAIKPRGDAASVALESGEELSAGVVVVAAPGPQTAILCADSPRVAAAADTCEMSPAWSLLAAFDAPLDAPDLIPGSAGATGAHRMSSKPGRAAAPERWVMEATPEWTAPRLEAEREDAVGDLLDLFAALTGARATPTYAAAHRWRYARTVAPVGRGCVADGPVIAAGDWMLGPDAGDAYASGLAAAGAVIERL